MNEDPALVVLSGGQDSTTCLYWAKKKFKDVKTITFNYNQRHNIEIDQARIIADNAKVEWDMLCIPQLKGTSPLTDSERQVKKYNTVEDLPTEGIEDTFVPGRNVLFLTMAANYASALGIKDIITGVGETDYANYPDCRRVFIDSMEESLSLGLTGKHEQIDIYTPLMYLNKEETVELAKELGCIEAMKDTHTCYEGKRPACGHCHACLLRIRGFEEAGIKDPLEYA